MAPSDVNFVSGLLQKSSFNKFDALQKKNVLHVRSSDSSKAQEKFNVSTEPSVEVVSSWFVDFEKL